MALNHVAMAQLTLLTCTLLLTHINTKQHFCRVVVTNLVPYIKGQVETLNKLYSVSSVANSHPHNFDKTKINKLN